MERMADLTGIRTQRHKRINEELNRLATSIQNCLRRWF